LLSSLLQEIKYYRNLPKMSSEESSEIDIIEMTGMKVPKSVLLHIFSFLDRTSLGNVAQVSKIFNLLRRHPSLRSSNYSGPHAALPVMQKVIPFPPPAVLQTTLPQVTTVNPAPHISTTLPKSTNVIVPVLPETVPMIAQVPDVVTRGSDNKGDAKEGKEVVQISQVLPGYAPSYANDYVPPLVNDHSFSTFANTISFNVSRYPTLSEVTDSKKYTDKKKEKKDSKEDKEDCDRGTVNGDTNSRDSMLDDSQDGVKSTVSVCPTEHGQTTLEYVPAEYFRGANCDQTISVAAAPMSVGFVKPDVLASGRLLNCMTPVPSLLTPNSTSYEPCSTTSTTSTIISAVVEEDGVHNNGTTNGVMGEEERVAHENTDHVENSVN
jgi:hypothetical protein